MFETCSKHVEQWWPSKNVQRYLVGGLEHVLFFHILGIIIRIDFHIFQWVETTNQCTYEMGHLLPATPCATVEQLAPLGSNDSWRMRSSVESIYICIYHICIYIYIYIFISIYIYIIKSIKDQGSQAARQANPSFHSCHTCKTDALLPYVAISH